MKEWGCFIPLIPLCLRVFSLVFILLFRCGLSLWQLTRDNFKAPSARPVERSQSRLQHQLPQVLVFFPKCRLSQISHLDHLLWLSAPTGHDWPRIPTRVKGWVLLTVLVTGCWRVWDIASSRDHYMPFVLPFRISLIILQLLLPILSVEIEN